MVSRGIWDKYRLVIFQNSPNITRRFAARDILVNFEISLAVFIPNTPRNHAITYTNCRQNKDKQSHCVANYANLFLKLCFLNQSSYEELVNAKDYYN